MLYILTKVHFLIPKIQNTKKCKNVKYQKNVKI